MHPNPFAATTLEQLGHAQIPPADRLMTNEDDVGTFDQHQPGHITRRPNSHPTERPENRRLLISELVPATLTVDPREVICADSFLEESKHFRVGDHPKIIAVQRIRHKTSPSFANAPNAPSTTTLQPPRTHTPDRHIGAGTKSIRAGLDLDAGQRAMKSTVERKL